MPVPANDPRLKRCGYAKLFGDGGKLDFVIRKHEVALGRPSKGKTIDVQLAEHKAVSREHAVIRYNFDTKQFELEVLGKNGVRVNGVDYKPGNPGGAGPVPLHSQSLLQIGEELSMYFLLPKAPRDVATAGRKRGSQALPPHLAPALKRPATVSARPASAVVAPPADVMQMFAQAQQAAAPKPQQRPVVQVQQAAAARPAPVQQTQTAAAPANQTHIAAVAQQQLLASLIQNPAALQQLLAASLQQQQVRPAAALAAAPVAAAAPAQAGLPPAALAAMPPQQQPILQQQPAASAGSGGSVASLAVLTGQQPQSSLAGMTPAQQQQVAMAMLAQQQQLQQQQQLAGARALGGQQQLTPQQVLQLQLLHQQRMSALNPGAFPPR